ncbi:MAG: rhodanese-like domain-containing protein [Candidatus Pacebacteria bacterium]|nr:rhodanese-like domain-containing protein [Candidatus Paceibacterota bacterium]
MFFSSTPSVSVSQALQGVQAPNTAFIDVRTRDEYREGHAQGAKNVPLDSLNDSDIERFKGYDAVYVICRSGGRSAAATKALISGGVHAINVSGGTLAWHAHGLPMA